MKKIYTLATAMLSLGLVNAQQNNDGPAKLNLKANLSKSIYQPRPLNQGGARCTQNSLYTETFDDPFNDGWTTTGDGSSGILKSIWPRRYSRSWILRPIGLFKNRSTS